VYTELLHFAVVLLTIVPLFFLVLHEFGGLVSLVAHLPPGHRHAWKGLPFSAPAAPMDVLGVTLGLGIVLSFGYWGTDFVQMQRALAVRRAEDVPYVPLSIAAAKIVFSFLIVLPGVAAPLILGRDPGNWNTTLSLLMIHYFNSSWTAIGVMGLTASLVSTFANNVSGFSSAFVQGVYQASMRPYETDEHYFRIGRMTNVITVVLSIGAAYFALSFQSLMEYIQMILSIFNAPIFALVSLAALAPKRVAAGGLYGLIAGLAAAIGHQLLVFSGVLHYGSRMTANFYAAMLSYSICALATVAANWMRKRRDRDQMVEEAHPPLPFRYSFPTVLWAGIVFAACVWVNIWLS
jgi:solute:Na+ symporter, SSS family